MKVKVDQELCTGCGPCVEICPEIFELEGDIAKVKVDIVPSQVEAACREAVEECPTDAISMEA